MLGFLVLVVYSKHLHIFLAPLNVAFSRRPNALGPLLPMYSDGKPIDFEDPRRGRRLRTRQGRGLHLEGAARLRHLHRVRPLPVAVPGLEHRASRCRPSCSSWACATTRSPRRRTSSSRSTPTTSRRPDGPAPRCPSSSPTFPQSVQDAAARPLVGPTEYDAHGHGIGGGVIDPDVLWSCTTCGACVEQCPVDIEHVDHIVDMRRYQVLIESEFPAELGGLFKNLENKGNPWGMNASRGSTGPTTSPFEVQGRRRGRSSDDAEYLFWVGCAGAFEDRAKKTTQAVAELLHMAGVDVRRARRGRDLHR